MHISYLSDIPLMSILKLLVDTFVSFLKRKVVIISLWNENIYSGFRLINDNSNKGKKGGELPRLKRYNIAHFQSQQIFWIIL